MTNPQILPIIVPAINWPDFAKAAASTIGYNPTNVNTSRPLSDYAKFLAACSLFKDRSQTDTIKSIRNSSSSLRHLVFGFLVLADRETLFELMQCSDLQVSTTAAQSGEVAAIVTGNLLQWQTAIIDLSESNTYGMRLLLDKIFLYFEKVGLGELWADYRKVPLKDNTLKLEHKK